MAQREQLDCVHDDVPTLHACVLCCHSRKVAAADRRYEGLTREDAPSAKGILVFGNGLGGGVQRAERGDK